MENLIFSFTLSLSYLLFIFSTLFYHWLVKFELAFAKLFLIQ